MTTRSKAQEIFKHLIENVLVQSPDSELSKALQREGITSFPALMSMTKDEIETLTLAADDGKIVLLHRSKHALVRALKSFIYYKQQLGETEYLNLTEDDFNIYRVEDYNPDDPHKPVKSTSTSSVSEKSKPTNNHRPPAEKLSEAEVIFHHIFKNVLKQVDDANIMKALRYENIRKVDHLFDLTLDEIRNFQYIDEAGEYATLNASEFALLALLQRFFQFNGVKYSYGFMAITYDDFDVFCIDHGFVLSSLLGQVDNYPSPSVPVTLDLDCEDDLNFVPVGENPAPDHDISSFSTPPKDLHKSLMHTCKEISDLDPSFDLTPSHVPNKCKFLDPSCTMNPKDKMGTCQVVHQKDVPTLDPDIEDKDNLNITGVTTTCSFNSEDAKSVSSVFDPDNEDQGIVNTRDTTIYSSTFDGDSYIMDDIGLSHEYSVKASNVSHDLDSCTIDKSLKDIVKDVNIITADTDMIVDQTDPIQELDKIATEVFRTLDNALLDFWATDAALQTHQNLEDLAKKINSCPRNEVPSFQVSMEILSDPVPATCVTTCGSKCFNHIDQDLNFQATLVDDSYLNGEENSVPPNIVPLPLPPPQPPPEKSFLEQENQFFEYSNEERICKILQVGVILMGRLLTVAI